MGQRLGYTLQETCITWCVRSSQVTLPAGFTGETRRNGEIWRLSRSPLPRRRRRVRRRNAVGAVSKLSDEGCSSRIPPSLLGLGVCSPLSRARGTRGTYYRPDLGFPRRSSRHSDRPTASLRDCRRCMLRGRCPRPPVGASVLFDRSGGDLVALRPQFEKEPLRPGPFGPVGAGSRRR